MSKSNLRKDMTCLNCGHVVDKIYCPNCGQENSEPKKSFSYLFTHFIEDLVHYDGYFWKTIKTLLCKPAALSVAYVQGKRARYVLPVKLYIFISFMTFFSLSITNTFLNSSKKNDEKMVIKENDSTNDLTFSDYKSLSEYDSINQTKPDNEKDTGFDYWITKRLTELNQKYTPQELKEQFKASLFNNTPKAIFIYMPFFAFGLWLFHDTKKFYYFDNGIFTLHFFSFLLLTFTVYYILANILSLFINPTFTAILGIGLILWWIFYFFRAHSIFYKENKWLSRLKSSFLLILNLIFMIILLVSLVVYSAINIH